MITAPDYRHPARKLVDEFVWNPPCSCIKHECRFSFSDPMFKTATACRNRLARELMRQGGVSALQDAAMRVRSAMIMGPAEPYADAIELIFNALIADLNQ
jgi:hypothetical protein